MSRYGWVVGWCRFGGWIICVNLRLMRHSTLTFFALINEVTGLDTSSRNILLFLIFHMLHMSATTLSILTKGLDDRILDNQFCTL